MLHTIRLSLLLLITLAACQPKKASSNESDQADQTENCYATSSSWSAEARSEGDFIAKQTSTPLVIDGCATDSIWSTAAWYSMNYIWMGDSVDQADYKGRFKLSWNQDYLYVLVEVTDDMLHPTLRDGKENYWKGDYVEVFIDEDRSGGDHKFNHQAFAYHVSTEGHAIDKDTQEQTIFLDDHVEVSRSQDGTSYLWEMAIRLYDDQFNEGATTNTPVQLTIDKLIGFSIAYGDNDGNQTRENFLGSKQTHGVNNDEGYINADVFGSVRLVE